MTTLPIRGREHCGLKHGVWYTLAVLSAAVAGCGGTSAVDPDVQDVSGLVTGLGDLAGMPEVFAESFVAGAAPKNTQPYGDYGYEVVSPVKVSGDVATVDVRIFGGVMSPSEGDKAKKPSLAGESTKTWTLRRVDEAWKIEDAPLQ